MSNDGRFRDEEEGGDIVRLESAGHERARMGWVNCGPWAIRIEMVRDGTLSVEAYPCQNEVKALGKIVLRQEEALAAGGVDCDGEQAG